MVINVDAKLNDGRLGTFRALHLAPLSRRPIDGRRDGLTPLCTPIYPGHEHMHLDILI